MKSSDLIENAALLIAMAAGFQVLSARWRRKLLRLQIASGLLFGFTAAVSMLDPVYFVPGVFFDGRSIILSAAGVFGGGVAAALAAIIAGGCRLWLGGAGIGMGLSVIAESVAAGLYLRRLRARSKRKFAFLEYWLMGLVVHC